MLTSPGARCPAVSPCAWPYVVRRIHSIFPRNLACFTPLLEDFGREEGEEGGKKKDTTARVKQVVAERASG